MSVMLYLCIFCVALLMDLFVQCVCNCLVKQLAICLDVVVILLLTFMELRVGKRALLEIPCMVFRRMCACCVCDPSVHLDVPFIGFVYVFPHLGV